MGNPRPTYTNFEHDQQFGAKVSKRLPDVERNLVEPIENVQAWFYNADLSVLQGPLIIAQNNCRRIGDMVFFDITFGANTTEGFMGSLIISSVNKELPGGQALQLYPVEPGTSSPAIVSASYGIIQPQPADVGGWPGPTDIIVNYVIELQYISDGLTAENWRLVGSYLANPVS